MSRAIRKLSRERLRRNLDEPSRAELYLALYMMIDRAQLCSAPIERLKEARDLIDKLIAGYKAVH